MSRRFGKREREAAAAALRPTSQQAASRLTQFVEDGGAVVTTGQQAGLFTGPLYTLYKVLTAVRLAQSLEHVLGVTVLPVFWTASEDHDWDEVDHTYVISGRDELCRLAMTSADARALPMSERRLDESIESALERLSQAVADKPFAADHLQLVRASYSPGSTVADAFRSTIEGLLAPFDLLVTDAADTALKRASAPLLSREVEHMEDHAARFLSRTEQIREAGYHVQVSPVPGASNLFFHGPNGRERLMRVDSRWFTRESSFSFTRRELLELVRDEPSRFSPNVALRPVVESSVFPVLAYVAGPGEVSYFAQLGELFEVCGFSMPVVYPRFSATLLPERVQQVLEEVGLSAEELTQPRHEVLSRLARRRIPRGVADALEELRRETVVGYARLMAEAEAVVPTLSGPLGANRNTALRALAASEQKVLREIKRASMLTEKRVDLLRRYLYPMEAHQERVLNAFPFLCGEGPSLLERLAAEVSLGLTGTVPPPVVAQPG